MSDDIEKLEQIRKKIDSIDLQFLDLLNQRAKLACQVAAIKKKQKEPIYYRPEREAQVLRNIVSQNQSPIADREVARIFRDIMTACLSLQKEMTIGYLGPEGTFTHQAAVKHFGEGAVSKPLNSIEEVFQEISGNHLDYGVVPIENTTQGMVTQTLDQLLISDVQICGEIMLRVRQHFACLPETKEIKTIFSHSQSLAQCRSWLAKHYPNAEKIAVESNAFAAIKAKETPHSACICGQQAIDHYGLENRHANVEDYANNSTRFIIIGQQCPAPSGKDKTSLIISSPHKAGSLSNLLKPFDEHQINMTLIESRPYQHRNWTYLFFIDFEGHQDEPHIKSALESLASMSVMMTLLGSYPQATG
ncbi:prephenate dehydratase [Legionella sp. W05-934-2]|uniref:prephenate dehydratase n=1 Tax=Legionella sp. W05-934-2 TaxID=1198649 RepID=UPI0034629BAB